MATHHFVVVSATAPPGVIVVVVPFCGQYHLPIVVAMATARFFELLRLQSWPSGQCVDLWRGRATDEQGQPVHIQGNVLWYCPVTVQGETETKLTMKPT